MHKISLITTILLFITILIYSCQTTKEADELKPCCKETVNKTYKYEKDTIKEKICGGLENKNYNEYKNK
jgi:hypothetical protein